MAIKVQITQRGNAEKTLAKMPVILESQLKKALRKGGNEQAKATRRHAPAPGYPGDKPGFVPLKNTIRTVVRSYRGGFAVGRGTVVVAVVGPKWPEGAHGHLVEFGHNIVRTTSGPSRTRPIPFMRIAADESAGAQDRAIVAELKKDVPKLAR